MKHLFRLNHYFWKYRGRFVLGIVFIILSNIFNVYAPVLVGEGVDFLTDALMHREQLETPGTSVALKPPPSLTTLSGWFGAPVTGINITQANFASTMLRIGLFLGIAYFIFYILKGIFLFFQRQTIIVMSRYIEYDQKNQIYRQYQDMDTSFYRRHRTGDLMNRISEDVSRVRMYLGPAVMYTINLIVLVIMCAGVMWNIDSELTLYSLSPLPFMAVAIFYVSTIINRRSERVQRQQSVLSGMVQESVSGIRQIRSYNREPFFIRQFSEAGKTYKSAQLKLVKADSMFMPVIVLLVGLSTILTIYIGSQKVIEGNMSYGVIVQFVFYVNQLTWPFASVGWVTSLIQKAEASQQRINEFLVTRSSIQEPPNPLPFHDGDIEFRRVSFTYPESGTTALKDVSFFIRKGEKVAIVGRTGSGKSTLANLLLRMYDPDSGEIRINEKPLKEYSVHSVRRAIGYVPQDAFLFSDTIRNNIAFGSDSISDQAVREAILTADLVETIEGFPLGEHTMLGERGINLSGGQKQRVAIARAILSKPSILLFDDCLSAVDAETEDHILNRLREQMRGKTSVFVAHRLIGLSDADQILVLERGEIAERGTHTSLMNANGLYAAMFRRQQAGFGD